MKITRQKLALSLMSASLAFSSVAAGTTQFFSAVFAEETTATANLGLLNEAVTEADALVADGALEKVNTLVVDYFNESLTTAKDLQNRYAANDTTLTQDEVNEAWMNLTDAIQMLDFISDKDALEAEIKMVDGTDLGSAVDSAVKAAFDKALADAKAVDADDTVLQDSIDEATDALVAAAKKADEALNKSISTAKSGSDSKQKEVDTLAAKYAVKNYDSKKMSAKTYNQIKDANAQAEAAKKEAAAAKAAADKAATLKEKVAAVNALNAALAKQKAAETALKNLNIVTIYRLYNPNNGEHLYTPDKPEVDFLVPLGWVYEGIGWYAPEKSMTKVTRLYNPNAKGGDHHYTADQNEISVLTKLGWKVDGIAMYADDEKNTPLYMLYNPNAETGTHHLTADTNERDVLDRIGWIYENIKFYAK